MTYSLHDRVFLLLVQGFNLRMLTLYMMKPFLGFDEVFSCVRLMTPWISLEAGDRKSELIGSDILTRKLETSHRSLNPFVFDTLSQTRSARQTFDCSISPKVFPFPFFFFFLFPKFDFMGLLKVFFCSNLISLDCHEVWYSWFWLEGSITAKTHFLTHGAQLLNSLAFSYVPKCS